MKYLRAMIVGLFAVLLMTACESYFSGRDKGDDDDNDTSSKVTGTWNGTGSYRHNGVAIRKFELVLNQDGNHVSGSYSIKRDARYEMNGSISGSSSGGSVNLTMSPHGHAHGSFSGNSMTLDWTESGFGGSNFSGRRDASVRLSR